MRPLGLPLVCFESVREVRVYVRARALRLEERARKTQAPGFNLRLLLNGRFVASRDPAGKSRKPRNGIFACWSGGLGVPAGGFVGFHEIPAFVSFNSIPFPAFFGEGGGSCHGHHRMRSYFRLQRATAKKSQSERNEVEFGYYSGVLSVTGATLSCSTTRDYSASFVVAAPTSAIWRTSALAQRPWRRWRTTWSWKKRRHESL